MKYILFVIFMLAFFERSSAAGPPGIDSTKLDRRLMARLDTIYNEDQGGRFKLIQAMQRRASAEEMDRLHKAVAEMDQKNVAEISSILAQYGWPGVEKVGYKGCETIFLVIQHADVAIQEKYLPMFRAAAKKGDIPVENLAILEDRMAMKQGKDQIYGSQVININGKRLIYPIENPDNLDHRRKSLGLSSMSDYLRGLNIQWDLDAYKKDLPEIRNTVKQIDFN
jgi:hypothetical protein